MTADHPPRFVSRSPTFSIHELGLRILQTLSDIGSVIGMTMLGTVISFGNLGLKPEPPAGLVLLKKAASRSVAALGFASTFGTLGSLTLRFVISL